MLRLWMMIILVTAGFSQQVKAQLVAFEPNLSGKYEITAAAKGSNINPYNITIQKPVGATSAYKIYMYNAGTAGGTPSSNIIVDGNTYSFTAAQMKQTGSYKGYSGAVAGALKTKLDAAVAGSAINLSVSEGIQTNETDGVGIIVVWNNPTKPVGSHFVYMGMDLITTAGTTINIPVSPIDKTIPGYEPILGIGINFSTGICNAAYGAGCQLAIITINGNTLTEKAGGFDDGANENGRLITLGGYGDDPNSNDEDELYNINSVLTNGATNLNFVFRDHSGDNDDVVNAIYFSGVGITPRACLFAPPTNTMVSNNCPASTVNLNTQAHTGTIPSGASLYWFTNNTHTGTRLSGTQVTEAGAGTYYAFYFDPLNACYSPASSAVTVTINACNYCVSGDCNPNTFINTSDPSTIEYDNMVSTFHSSMLRNANGTVTVWGQGIGQDGTMASTSHIAPPKELNSTNYPVLTGGKILKFTAAGYFTSGQGTQQFAALTTDGLFIWGTTGVLVGTGITNQTAMKKVAIGTAGVSGGATKADGLPAGVAPADVKMFFGSHTTLAITTCKGEAWVLAGNYKNGDGTTTNPALWHRVKTDATTTLDNVVALRGTADAMLALTADGKLYTWGAKIYDGNGALTNQSYAKLMTIPAGVSPKMIGMTRSSSGVSYYLLGTNGNLYALGENGYRQLGDFTQLARTSWVQVKKSSAANDFLTNVSWISPQEHEGGNIFAAINVITKDPVTQNTELWNWGSNDGNMISSRTANIGLNPSKELDDIIAVETGGHTSLAIKSCASKFGYIGHKVNGSMGNNIDDNVTETSYNFDITPPVNICGAVTSPLTNDLKICSATTANLDNANLELPINQVEWHTGNTRTSSLVANPHAVPAGTYYAFFTAASGKCPNAFSPVVVSYYQPADLEYANCPTCNAGTAQVPLSGNTTQN